MLTTLSRRWIWVLAPAASLLAGTAWAAPVIVDFENNPSLPTGPSTFGGDAQTVTVPGIATFTGGTVLGNETSLPAQSFATSPNVYGTAYFPTGNYEPVITISIDPDFKVSEVSFPGFNGFYEQSYTATAYNGLTLVATQTSSLASNGNSGYGLFDLKASNITSVTFAQTVPTDDWDFSIDSVEFNGNIAMSPVPLPGSAPLLGTALLAVGVLGYVGRRAKPATST